MSSLETRIKDELSHAVSYDGYAFRNVAQKYAGRSAIHSTMGSILTGARFNYIGTFGALYLSASWTTCFVETLHNFKDDAEIAHALPRTVIGFEVHCSRLLDLTSAETLRRLILTEDDILRTNWVYEQDVLGVEAVTQEPQPHNIIESASGGNYNEVSLRGNYNKVSLRI